MFWHTQVSYEFGPFRVDTRERQLLRDGRVVPLRPKVFDVLLMLVQNSGHIVSKDEVMKHVWFDTAVEEGNISRNISTLRNALGERPREHRYIETIPWRGYRFVANVREVHAESPQIPIRSLAVLPFANVAEDEGLEYLADGVTENLIHNLSQLTQLKVMSRNSVFRYKGLQVEASMVCKELQVDAALFGRFIKQDNLITISIELVNARDNTHIWGAQYTRKSPDIFKLQEQIAEEITSNLRIRLPSEQQERLPQRHTRDPEAYHLYLKGRYYFNKLTPDGVQRGIEYFKRAIEKDSSYALAYVGLGDCHTYWAQPSQARDAMARALAIDDTLGEAHASLGFYKFVYDWDFAGAEKEFRQGLKLSPNYAEAHHWSAIYFGNMGRHDEAESEAKLAVELDPLSLLINMTPGLTSYLAREYQRAVEQLLKVIDLDSNFAVAHSVLGNAYLQLGLFEKAMAEYEKVLGLSGDARIVELAVNALMAHAYAKSGDRSRALKMLEQLEAASQNSDRSVPNISPHSIAEVHAALGQNDLAFAWLNRAYEEHDMQMVSLRVNPTLDPLRDDSRFQVLLQLVGL
jgi:TolB-like protein/Tfp pilus assembly protein PilF